MKLSKRASLDIDAQLYESVEEGDLGEVQKFLKFGADPDYIDGSGFSCLMAAVWYGFINIATLLIAKGANVHFKHNGFYLIHYAAASDDLAMFKVLLNGGAKIDSKNDNGNTPLEVAESQNAHDVIDFIENYQPQKPVDTAISVKPVDKDIDFFKPKAPSCPTCGKDAPGYTCPTCGDIPFFADDKRASGLSNRFFR